MKKLILTSLAAMMFTAAADASRAGLYLGGYARTGMSTEWSGAVATMVDPYFNQNWFDTVALDATVGYRFRNGLRLEVDVASMYLDRPAGFGFGMGAGMMRALYDIKGFNRVVPYFGVGLASDGFFSTGWVDGGGFNIAGALVGGVSFNIDRHLVLDMQYSRIMASSWVEGLGRFNNGANEVRMGMRYHF